MKFILVVATILSMVQSYSVLQRIMINKFEPVFDQMDTTMTGSVNFDNYNLWMKEYYKQQGYSESTVEQYKDTFKSNFKEMSGNKEYMSMDDVKAYVLKKYI